MENIKTETHPCQYCEKPCIGRQCRDCHLKMISKTKSKCLDCNQIFQSLRKDGTQRVRCKECQERYNDTFMAKCPDCVNSYHAFLKDGRIFEKCFDCYKKNIKFCSKCNKKTINGHDLCVGCHKQSIKTGECKCGADTNNGFSLCIKCHKNTLPIARSPRSADGTIILTKSDRNRILREALRDFNTVHK